MSNHAKGKVSTSVYASHLIQDESGEVICSTWTYNHFSQNEREANARHIASLWNTDLEYDHTHTAEVVEALELLFEHCRVYHREVERNNVGEAVNQALKNIKREKV